MNTTTENTKKKEVTILLSFISLMAFSAITPAMNTFFNAWPSVPMTTIYLIFSLPLLTMAPVTIITGKIAGKSVSFKSLAILGNFMVVIFGCAPAVFSESITGILICRALFGIGLGIITPIGNTLALRSLDEERSNKVLGYGTLVMNVASIILQQLSGILCGIRWNLTFWCFAIGILPLIGSFFITEPAALAVEETTTKQKLPGSIWLLATTLLLLNTANLALMVNVSILFANKGIDNPVQSALALSFFGIGGCTAGLVFGKCYSRLKGFLLSFSILLCVVGQLLLLFGPGILIMSVGTFCTGFGFSTLHTGIYAYVNLCADKTVVPFAISIVMTFLNISGFISTYYLATIERIFGNSLYTSYYIAIAIYLVLAFIYLFYHPKKKAS